VIPVLAIDIGGTKMALALVDETGAILDQLVVPTTPSDDAEAVYAPLHSGLATLLGRHEWPDGAPDTGIGSAGPIDVHGSAAGVGGSRGSSPLLGTVSPVNISAWRDFPLVARVAASVATTTGRAPQVRLAGDGHCIALGEHWLGAGRDVASLIGVVISTGVGGGAVLDDRLVTGTTGNAVHLGHTSVNAWGEKCVCGGYGCVEMYARGPAMVEAARARGWTGDDGIDLTRSAANGDPVATEVIDNGMRAAAAGIAATATQLDIDVVVVGGGLSKAGEVIFEPLRRHLTDFATLPYVQHLDLRVAELDNAGLLGAASLALSLSGRGSLRAELGS